MYIKHLLVKKYMDVQRLMYCYVRSIEAICITRTNFQTKIVWVKCGQMFSLLQGKRDIMNSDEHFGL